MCSAQTYDTADAARAAAPPDTAAEARDVERAKLMQADAVVKCLPQVLRYAEDAQYCADSAQLTARATDDAVMQLGPHLPDRARPFDAILRSQTVTSKNGGMRTHCNPTGQGL